MTQVDRFQAAVSAALAGKTVVTANARGARDVRSACEARLTAAQKAWRTPDILSFEGWLARLWEEVLLSGSCDLALLRPVQEQALWERVVTECAGRDSLLNKGSAASSAAEAWRLVHHYCIPLSASAFQSTPETTAFFQWACKYSDICANQRLVDSARLPEILAVRLGAVRILPKHIVLFGFDELTPRQRLFVAALLRAGITPEVLLPDEAIDLSSTRCVSLADSSSELRAAARWARRTLEDDPSARVGIVVPSLGALHTIAEHIFTDILHPECFVAGVVDQRSAFDVSAGPRLADYPLIRTALLILRLALGPIATIEVGELLLSPHLEGGIEEASRRALLDSYLRANTGDMLTLSQMRDHLEAVRDSWCSCPRLQPLLVRLAEVAAQLLPGMSPSVWARQVAKLLKAVGWPNTGHGGRVLKSVEFQVHVAWSDMLSEFSALDLAIDSESPQRLCARLGKIAADQPFRAENMAAPVQVLGHFEASGSVFDHLWITGLSDDVWPARGHPNPFIPMALQRTAGVPHCTPKQELAFTRLVTARLVQSASDVVISWPKHEDDRDLRPSPLLANIRPVTEAELCGTPTPGWVTLQGGAEPEFYQDETAQPISPHDVVHRGTALLRFQSNCPFRAFIENRLAGAKLETPRMGLDPRLRGKLIEKTLELVWRQLRDQVTLNNTGRADLDAIVFRAIDDTMTELWTLGNESWAQRYRAHERERLANLTHEWLEVEKRREPFEVMEHQLQVEVELAGLVVRGIVDRIDRLHDGSHVVIDYKSGAGSYSPGQWAIPRPEEPQLPFYVVSELEKRQDVSALAYAQVRTGECALRGYGARKEILGQDRDMSTTYFGAATFPEHIRKWKPELERLVASFLGGDAAVDPNRPPTDSRSSCNWCHLPGLCHVSQQENGERG